MMRNENNLIEVMMKEKITNIIRTFEEAGYLGLCGMVGTNHPKEGGPENEIRKFRKEQLTKIHVAEQFPFFLFIGCCGHIL